MPKRKLGRATNDDVAVVTTPTTTAGNNTRRRSSTHSTPSASIGTSTTRKKARLNKNDVNDEEDDNHPVSVANSNTIDESSGDVVVATNNDAAATAATTNDPKKLGDGFIQHGTTDEEQRSSHSPGVVAVVPTTDENDSNGSKYDVRQKVLARDQDGLLYYGHIRRKLYGINHQESISVLGIFDLSIEEVERSRKGATMGTSNGDDEEDQNNSSNVTTNGNTPGWFYFVHFEGWKVNWDRWLVESDIVEATAKNVERMDVVMKAHKALQHEVKSKSKQRKIHDAGLFLKLWKQRLDGLYEEWDKLDNPSPPVVTRTAGDNNNNNNNDDDKGKVCTKKKKDASPKKRDRKTKSEEDKMKDIAKLAVQSCLTTRDATHVQAIPLAFGLKRVLVEDWEILNAASRGDADEPAGKNVGTGGNSCGMVHCLPAKVTIRDALTAYMKEKGVVWDGISTDRRQRKNKMSSNNAKDGSLAPPTVKDEKNNGSETRPSLSERDDHPEPIRSTDELAGSSEVVTCTDKETVVTEPSSMAVEIVDPISGVQVKNLKHEADNGGKGCVEDEDYQSKSSVVESVTNRAPPDTQSDEKLVLKQQWTDMADGIAIYFEQALLTRLLYPSEVAQYVVLEDTLLNNDTPPLHKVDIYGCEHLLRLLSVMPRILDQQLKDFKSKRMKKTQKQETSTDVLFSDEGKSIEPQEEDGDNDFVQKGSMILAKLQDLARFLQKNQSSLFCSMYRKRTEAEVKQDLKIQKRLERRLKRKTDLNGLNEEELQQKVT